MSVARLSDWTTVACAGCGEFFELSDRANRTRLLAGREPVCRDCRFPSVVVVTDPLIEWWRTRGFTPALAREICDDWPDGIREVLGGCTEEGFSEMMSA